MGKMKAALMSYQIAIDIDKGSTGAHDGQARTFLELGRFEEALESFRRVVDLSPDNAEAYLSMGVTLSNLGREQ
jgi:Flp pilus assembly protein TadD